LGLRRATYAFTGRSNANTTTATNSLNQLSTVAGTSAAYDSNGNLTTDPTSAKSYAYDAAKRKVLSYSGFNAIAGALPQQGAHAR
jgi:hypothetical protein